MPDFAYVALDGRGKESRGTLRSADSGEACARIKEMGLFPTKLVERKPEAPSRAPPSAPVRGAARGVGFRRTWPARRDLQVKPKVLTAFTRQLATLIEAGMPLLRGLRLLGEQERRSPLGKVLADLGGAIEGGASFSEALARHPKIFNALFLNMIKAGEIGGALEIALERLAGFMEKAQRIRGKVIAALFYPVAVLFIAVTIVAVMMVFVLPKFREVFAELVGQSQLPVFTEFIFGLSTAVQHHFPALAGAAILLGLLLGWFARTRFGRSWVDRFKLRMPILGPVICKAAIARFARTLGTLVNSGVPILQALTIVRDTAGNVIVGRAVQAVHESVKEGETVAEPLRAAHVFPAVVCGMVDVGEQTGALPEMLMKIADIYDEEVDNAVAAMTSLLEPILIVFLAVVVGSIVIALYLPIIDLVTGGGLDPKDGGS